MACVVVDRVAVGWAGAGGDVRTAGRDDRGAGVVRFFVAVTDDFCGVVGGAIVVEVVVEVVVVEVDDAGGVEIELLVTDVLEAVLVGAVDTDGEPPVLPVPHPVTAINSTGMARNRRRMPRTVIDSSLQMWPQHSGIFRPLFSTRAGGSGMAHGFLQVPARPQLRV